MAEAANDEQHYTKRFSHEKISEHLNWHWHKRSKKLNIIDQMTGTLHQIYIYYIYYILNILFKFLVTHTPHIKNWYAKDCPVSHLMTP